MHFCLFLSSTHHLAHPNQPQPPQIKYHFTMVKLAYASLLLLPAGAYGFAPSSITSAPVSCFVSYLSYLCDLQNTSHIIWSWVNSIGIVVKLWRQMNVLIIGSFTYSFIRYTMLFRGQLAHIVNLISPFTFSKYGVGPTQCRKCHQLPTKCLRIW